MTSLDLALHRVCKRRIRPGRRDHIAYALLRRLVKTLDTIGNVLYTVSTRISTISYRIRDRLEEIEVRIIVDRILSEGCGVVIPRYASDTKIIDILEAYGFKSIVFEEDDEVVDFIMVKGHKCVRFKLESIEWGDCRTVFQRQEG